MIEGNFIVLEGVDGSGKSTQSRILANALRARGLPVHLTREPSDGPIGALLRHFLTGRAVVPGLQGPRPPSWSTLATLFAADRLDHLESEIIPNLMDGVTVISDRYLHSSLVFQSVTAGEEPQQVVDWIREINRYARPPDLTLVLDLPAEMAGKRRRSRSSGREIFDDDQLQRELADAYRRLHEYFPQERIVHIDAARPEAEVAAAVMLEVRRLRNEA